MSREREDLKRLVAVTLSVPLTWLALLGWRVSQSVSAHDATTQIFLFLADFLKGGGTDAILYRPGILGGVEIASLGILFPIHDFFRWLHMPPIAALNGTAFFLQICHGFLCCRAAADLSALWTGKIQPTWGGRFATAWIFCFAPLLAWRLGYGHFNAIAGTLFFSAALAAIAALRASGFTFTLSLVMAISLVNCFPTAGQQYLLYGWVFGGPILIGLLAPWLRENRDFSWKRLRPALVPALIFAGSALFCAPRIAGLLAQALGDDSGRSLHAPSLIYSFTTATAGDWLSSIPWSSAWIPAGRPMPLWHEVNYPLGPFLALLALLPWRKSKDLGVGIGISFFLALCFSMGLPPVAELLPRLLPPLESFRVPARAMVPLALTIPVLGVCAVQHAASKKTKPLIDLIGLAIGLFLFFLQPKIREVALWLAVGTLVIRYFINKRYLQKIPATAILLALGLAGVGAFRERLLRFPSSAELITEPAKLAAALRLEAPALESPLTRAQLAFELPRFNANTGYALGVSTLEGYWYPSSRWLSLQAALRNELPNPTAVNFPVDEQNPGAPILRQLYNVRLRVRPEAPDRFDFSEWSPPPIGPAWFSAAIATVPTMEDLVRALRDTQPSFATAIREQTWVVGSDPAVERADLAPGERAGCRTAAVRFVESRQSGQSIRIGIQTAADCPLTLAMNYFSSLRARAFGKETGEKNLAVFPAYGAVTGVIAPAGAEEILVEAVASGGRWAVVVSYLGLALLAFSGFLSFFSGSDASSRMWFKSGSSA